MNGIELWRVFVLPVIQFLIGPIVTGAVIFRLTSRAAKQKENDMSIRQLNVLKSKIEKTISLVGELNKELENLDEYDLRIDEIKHDDLSGVDEELRNAGSKGNILNLYIELKTDSGRNIMKLKKEIESSFRELSDLEIDLLPTKVHGELIDLMESKKVELDLNKHKQLLKNVKKHI